MVSGVFVSIHPRPNDVCIEPTTSRSNGKQTQQERQDVWEAQHYVEHLLTLQYGGKGLVELLRTIRINMATYSRAWIEEFLCHGGIEALMMFLPDTTRPLDELECNEILKVFTTLASNAKGCDHLA